MTTLDEPTTSSTLDRSQRWMPVATLLLGLGAAAVALLGPLMTGVIEYHASEGAVNQIAGGDFAGLVLVAPLCIAAAWLLWRRHPAGPLLATGPAFYGLYMYSQLALGGDVLRYPGNSERFFPLYLALFVLAGAVAISSWASICVDLPAPSRRLDRTFAWFLLVVAAFLSVGLHIPGLVDAWSSAPSSSEYLADPTVFWLVKFMDLGLVVPALVATAVGISVRRPWAARARYGAAGWTALLGSSVAGMAIVMQATDDPAASTANTVAFSSFALVALGIAWSVYRPLFHGSARSRNRLPASQGGMALGNPSDRSECASKAGASIAPTEHGDVRNAERSLGRAQHRS